MPTVSPGAPWALSLLAVAGTLLLPHQPAPVRRPKVLPEAVERDLALEALPPVLRAKAGVWTLTASGMRELRPTANGFTCVVNRDEVLAIKPTCYDAEGTATILPVVVRFADLLMQGKPVPEIRAEIAAGFASGQFRSPSRAGVAFMMSPNIVNVIDPDKPTLGTAPPHYMIYAPNVTNEQLGITNEAYSQHPWLPFAAYTGPQGFIIVTLPDSAVVNAGHTMHAGPAKASSRRKGRG